jgi:hypothetical protein
LAGTFVTDLLMRLVNGRRWLIKLNICMKQFRATVRASGLIISTIVFAENANFAVKILQAQFGVNNAIGIPTQL